MGTTTEAMHAAEWDGVYCPVHGYTHRTGERTDAGGGAYVPAGYGREYIGTMSDTAWNAR
jgi:hypothetical protein